MLQPLRTREIEPVAGTQAPEGNRRVACERRRPTLASYWLGALRPRRHAGRRREDRFYPVIDWHQPRLLVPALLIFFLCVADAFLTITLMHHGAIEANPVMAALLHLDIRSFAGVKLLVTALGTCVLVACARMHMFRRLPGEVFLYVMAAGYVALIVYELRMLGDVTY
jgi:hypothetical protein